MLASYFLSRTVVPVMAKYMLKGHAEGSHDHHKGFSIPVAISAVNRRVDKGFNKLRDVYQSLLTALLARRLIVVIGVLIFMCVSLSLIPFLGEDFFPTIDAGILRMHVSAPRGMRVEETERLIKRVEREISTIIPAREIENVADIMGVPNSGLNLSSSDSVNYTEADGEILVTLTKEHRPSSYYKGILRDKLPTVFPDCIFFFQPANIVTQILNAGIRRSYRCASARHGFATDLPTGTKDPR